MIYEQCTVTRLDDAIEWESYVGGSHNRTLDGLRRYIESKRVGDMPARDMGFRWCGYARVQNVRYTEDGLLDMETLWNTHQASNLFEDAGFVYLLRKSRPLTGGQKVAIGAGLTGVAFVGLLALNELFKQPSPITQVPARSGGIG